MSTSTLRLGFAALMIGGGLAAGTAQSDEPQHGTPHGKVAQQMVVPGSSPYLVQGGYFSHRLGAQFVIQTIQIGQFNAVRAARITSEPLPGSPLNQLGMGIGDVITRLDGIPVTRKSELENHIHETHVRFVKAGQSFVRQGWMYVNSQQVFQDYHYPPDWNPSGDPVLAP